MSKFVFGTMNLHQLETQNVLDLLCFLLSKNVTTFHSSHEYDSFDVFCAQLKVACKRVGINSSELRHVVKLASPHFHETDISQSDIYAKIDYYRSSLNVSQLHDVQWMARMDLQDEPARLRFIQRQSTLVCDITQSLRDDHKTRYVSCFPYTVAFAQAAISSGAFDHIVDYSNPEDDKSAQYRDAMTSQGMSLVVLRPFGAGQSLTKHVTATQLYKKHVRDPQVAAIVCGTHSYTHAQELLTCEAIS